MPDITPGMTKLLTFWPQIQEAVSEYATTADLWTAYKSLAAAAGGSPGGVSIQDMNALRGIATGNRNAMLAFGRAAPGVGIEGGMIGTTIYARDLSTQAVAPEYVVRFEHQVMVDGELQSIWRSDIIALSLGMFTKQSLLDMLNADAEQLAEDYGQSHVGVGQVMITAR